MLNPWPTFLVKKCLNILLPSITKLVNCSLSEGLVPESFKKVVVTPLIKRLLCHCDDINNYRPVSGLCFKYKLVEWVVASQMIDHIHSHGLDNRNGQGKSANHTAQQQTTFCQNLII